MNPVEISPGVIFSNALYPESRILSNHSIRTLLFASESSLLCRADTKIGLWVSGHRKLHGDQNTKPGRAASS